MQVGEGRVAGAEVVQRQFQAQLLELGDEAAGLVAAFDQQGLGQFQDELLGGQAAVVQGLAHRVDQIAALGLGGRDVDGHLEGRQAFVQPGAGLTAGFVQGPGADLGNEPAALGNGHEMFGQDEAEFAMMPADERFDAGDLQGATADLGLIEKAQLLVTDGVAQVVLQRQCIQARLFLGGVEILDAMAAATLGQGHGLLGMAGELGVIGGVVGEDGHAHAGRDEEFLALDVQGQAQDPMQFFQTGGVLGIAGTAGQQGHEAVGAGARQPGAGGAEAAAAFRAGVAADQIVQPLADGFQEGIANGMAQTIVELPETVQVQQHERAGAGRGAQHRLQPAHEAGVIGQAGQQVLTQQTVPIEFQPQALAQLQQQGGFIQGLDQHVGQVQGESLAPQEAGITRGEQDDGQALPGRVLELLAQPVQAGIFGPIQMHEQQRRCALTLDDFLGFARILNDAERAQPMGIQQP